jgi:nucleotide-binding universal stress UspA family protein
LGTHPGEELAPRGFFVALAGPAGLTDSSKEQEMARIVVAIDGSPASEKALEVAVKLAQQNGGQVTAVSVLDRPADPHLDRLAEGLREKSRHHLGEVLEAAGNFARSRGVRLTPLLREGHPADTIIACAEQEQADLLVLGSQNGPAARPGLGGTADQVSSHSPCTTILVR